MTLKQNSKKILDIVASGEGINATDAYRRVHPEASDNTARSNSYQLLRKPEAQIYLQKHIEKAKRRIVNLVDSEKEEIALRASDSILDRALGKATQRTEVTSQSVHFSIDLTGSNPKDDVEYVSE